MATDEWSLVCPLCNEVLVSVVTGTAGDSVVAEAYDRCSKGHYLYEFSYGFCLETINGVTMEWSDGSNVKAWKNRMIQRQQVIAEYLQKEAEVMENYSFLDRFEDLQV